MKKLFFSVAIVAAMSLAACGGKKADAPAEEAATPAPAPEKIENACACDSCTNAECNKENCTCTPCCQNDSTCAKTACEGDSCANKCPEAEK